MAEEFDEDAASVPTGGPGSINPAALDAAMTGPSAATKEARDFLRRQSALTDLQSRILHEQHALELSHLQWRRFNDQMKGALQFMVVGVGALIVFGLAAIVWSAANDHALVVDSFSVPSDLAAQGETGAVIAVHVMDAVATMENQTTSFRAKSSYQNDWSNDIKVQIPDTGISVGDAYRLLVGWIGSETHISGEIVHAKIGYAVTVRVGSGSSATFEGPALPALVAKSAEHVM